MKPRTQKSIELYNTLLNRGFPQEFCEQISRNLNTDWTAQRMLGYLSHYRKLPMAEIVDEMLAILSDRNRIMHNPEFNPSVFFDFLPQFPHFCRRKAPGGRPGGSCHA